MIILDDITQRVDSSLFKLEPMLPRATIDHPPLAMGIEIEMNYDQIVVSRVGYNIFDLLSDLGGMQRVLSTIFGVITAVFNFKHFETYLAS